MIKFDKFFVKGVIYNNNTDLKNPKKTQINQLKDL